MRLNETALRRRLNAICTGRDDRLIVLLSMDSGWMMQREAVHWVRALRKKSPRLVCRKPVASLADCDGLACQSS